MFGHIGDDPKIPQQVPGLRVEDCNLGFPQVAGEVDIAGGDGIAKEAITGHFDIEGEAFTALGCRGEAELRADRTADPLLPEPVRPWRG